MQAQEALIQIAMNMELEEFAKDEKLFSHGDVGTKFYMILKGSVSILIP